MWAESHWIEVVALKEGNMFCTLLCTVALLTGTYTGVLVADIRKRS
jgi:hypothetical protein